MLKKIEKVLTSDVILNSSPYIIVFITTIYFGSLFMFILQSFTRSLSQC